MIEKGHPKKCKNDTIKIVLYMIFMTAMFTFYCRNNNIETVKSVDNYHAYFNEIIIDQLSTVPLFKNVSNVFTRIDDQIKKGYVVWNENCRIPNISAYDRSIKKLIKKSNAPKCSSKSPLTSVVLDLDSWSYTLKINRDGFITEKTNQTAVHCCYSPIIRKELKFKKHANDDDRYEIERACHPINDSDIIPKSVEFMLVKCELKSGGDKFKSTVYKEVHAMVIDKGRRRFRNADVPDKPSVLIIAIDSLSRLNLIRAMPMTHHLLETRGFMSLEGYNKVADNTFPNVVPILTGMFVGQMVKRCWKKPTNEMDDCPFLWKDFQEKGYVTAYMEDEPSMGTYNFGKYGFLNSPTDYYPRPYMLAAERLLPVLKYDGMAYCQGPRSAPDRVYGYLDDFVRLHRHHGYFAVFWLNTFSHNDVNMPSSTDRQTAEALSRLLDDRLLDNAVTAVISDHGLRFGKIRQTHVGWLEDRMPAFYARLPPGYAAAHPGHGAALAANRHRLTSPFDLHLTLKQLLSDGRDAESRVVAEGCKTCRSLFRLADANRSCEQAGIAPHWCTCDEYELMDSDSAIVAEAGAYVVRQLNGLLAKYRKSVIDGYACSSLSLNRIVSARRRTVRRTGRLEYLLVVETLPGYSMFEVTFGVQSDGGDGGDGHFGGELSDLSRVNMYGFQSHCTEDWRLKKHCYCVKAKKRKPGG